MVLRLVSTATVDMVLAFGGTRWMSFSFMKYVRAGTGHRGGFCAVRDDRQDSLPALLVDDWAGVPIKLMS